MRAGPLRERRIAGRAEGHRARKLGAAGDAHADAELEVGRVQQRHLREPLQAVQRGRRLERLAEDHGAVGRVEQDGRYRLGAAKDEEAANVRPGHEIGELAERVGVVWRIR